VPAATTILPQAAAARSIDPSARGFGIATSASPPWPSPAATPQQQHTTTEGSRGRRPGVRAPPSRPASRAAASLWPEIPPSRTTMPSATRETKTRRPPSIGLGFARRLPPAAAGSCRRRGTGATTARFHPCLPPRRRRGRLLT
jgi:hypothetical protein